MLIFMGLGLCFFLVTCFSTSLLVDHSSSSLMPEPSPLELCYMEYLFLATSLLLGSSSSSSYSYYSSYSYQSFLLSRCLIFRGRAPFMQFSSIPYPSYSIYSSYSSSSSRFYSSSSYQSQSSSISYSLETLSRSMFLRILSRSFYLSQSLPTTEETRPDT